MATTPNLGMTLVEQSQAQKEITVNMAFTRIDALLNGHGLDKDLAVPPASPAEGDMYIIASGATEDWAGHDGEIAYFEQIWRFIVPNSGMTLWVADESRFYVYDGAAWVANYSMRSAINTQIATGYTLAVTDRGDLITCDNASAITMTLPNDLPAGFECTVLQVAAGAVTFSAASGAILRHRQSHTKTAGQYALCKLFVLSNSDGSSAEYILSGDSAA
ncbi:MAG: DUF2793 domain-containing protein [Alphaproteobacteria bacterium]|nr:DUF2793 domain-containing protein [Alphaproteobacteria bacterium]